MPRKKKSEPSALYRPQTWQAALDMYIIYIKAKGLRETTIASQKQTISMFFKRHECAFSEQSKLKEAVYTFLGEDVKPATFNYRLTYLKSFFNWGISEGIFTFNPCDGFKKRKTDSRIVQIDEETIKRLLDLPDKTTFSGLRDYCMILVTLDTGIRPREAFNLTVEDVNFTSNELYIRSEVSKTKVSRTLPLSPPTIQWLRKLIMSRHPDWDNSITPLLCTYEGGKLNSSYWHDRMMMYSRQLGVRIRPYDLRHTFALYFLRNGGHALALQRMMGHSDLGMTKRYVALTEGDIKQQHDLASPAMKLVQQSKRVRKIKK